MDAQKSELTEPELEEHLDEQLDFLKRSCRAYDEGYESEVKRLAVTVRVLVHDTGNSTSLLMHLRRKSVLFFDTAMPAVHLNQVGHSSLVRTLLGTKGSKCYPLLDEGPFSRCISFDDWWNGVVFVDMTGAEFSRRDIVLSLANKEGGAHVDTRLDKDYANLRKKRSIGFSGLGADGKEVPPDDHVPPAMRQIAHEILRTLITEYKYQLSPDLLPDLGSTVWALNPVVVPPGSAPDMLGENRTKRKPYRGVTRNQLCPCGSGKVYKRCCYHKKK